MASITTSPGYIGDLSAGQTVRWSFNTISGNSPITLGGTPSLACYKDGDGAESTAGITLSVDFDGKTGLHRVLIDTSVDGTFYSTGSDFLVVIAAGTVDGATAVGLYVGQFSIGHRTGGGGGGGGALETSVQTVITNIAALHNVNKTDIVSNGAITTSGGKVSEVALVDVTSVNSDMRGTDSAALATSLAALIATVGVAGAGLTAADDAMIAAIAALHNLSEADVRTAIGLLTANLDTQLDALPTNTELATALGTADDATLAAIGAVAASLSGDNDDILAAIGALNNLAAGAAMTLTSGERDALALAIMVLADGVEAGYSLRTSLRLQNAFAFGKLSGVNTNTPTFRDPNDTKDRIIAATDPTGRTSVTLDPS